MYKNPNDFMNYVESKNPGEKEFLQAVDEVVESLICLALLIHTFKHSSSVRVSPFSISFVFILETKLRRAVNLFLSLFFSDCFRAEIVSLQVYDI